MKVFINESICRFKQAFYLQVTIKVFQMYFLISVTEIIVHDDI